MKSNMSINARTFSGLASEDIDGFLGVKIDTSGGYEDYRFALATSSDECIGVAIADAKSGEDIGVAIEGVVMVTVNADTTPITEGDKLNIGSTDGVFEKAGAGEDFFAIALDPSTSDGDVIRAILRRGTIPAAP